MANAYSQLYAHLVFAPKYRRAIITPEIKAPVEKYMTGIIQGLDARLIEIFARPDHVHSLIGFRTTHMLSALINKLKSNSSRWIARNHNDQFKWQDGGGYFTVGHRQVNIVRRYIQRQDEHHGAITMPKEFEQLLEQHGLKDELERKYWLVDPEEGA